MYELFVLIGLYTVCIAGICAISFAVVLIWKGIDKLRWRYKYKHRFDKKPIAKCYCIDCKYHGRIDDNTLCQLHDKHFPNDWFCKDAKPKSAK